MSAAALNTSKADPNLTPMLDMVFQLITFFMLVINFQAASVDRHVRLPLLGSARPVATGSETDVLVLNVSANGELKVYGHVQEAEAFLRSEAEMNLAELRQRGGKNANLQLGDELPTTVVVRADRSTPFANVNRVLRTCQRFGFRKISFKALEI